MLPMDSTATDANSQWIKVVETSSLLKTGRIHTCIQGRYVSILQLDGKLTCIDAICFHAGGPLGLGDIEDVQGKTCLVCPWHHYKIDAFTGEKYYQAVTWKDGKMVPGDWKSNGPRQRVHQVEARPDGCLYVLLDDSDNPSLSASDEHAYKTTCGERLTCSPNTTAGARQSMSAAGADGIRPQGNARMNITRLKVKHATGSRAASKPVQYNTAPPVAKEHPAWFSAPQS